MAAGVAGVAPIIPVCPVVCGAAGLGVVQFANDAVLDPKNTVPEPPLVAVVIAVAPSGSI